jgi:hypothetical protein
MVPSMTKLHRKEIDAEDGAPNAISFFTTLSNRRTIPTICRSAARIVVPLTYLDIP